MACPETDIRSAGTDKTALRAIDYENPALSGMRCEVSRRQPTAIRHLEDKQIAYEDNAKQTEKVACVLSGSRRIDPPEVHDSRWRDEILGGIA